MKAFINILEYKGLDTHSLIGLPLSFPDLIGESSL